MNFSKALAVIAVASAAEGMTLQSLFGWNSYPKSSTSSHSNEHFVVLAEFAPRGIFVASRTDGFRPFNYIDNNPTSDDGYDESKQVYFSIIDNSRFQSVAEIGGSYEMACLNKCLQTDSGFSMQCANNGYEEVSLCGSPHIHTTQDFEIKNLNRLVAEVPVFKFARQLSKTLYAMRPFTLSMRQGGGCFTRDRNTKNLSLSMCGRTNTFEPNQFFFLTHENKIISPASGSKLDSVALGLNDANELIFDILRTASQWEYMEFSGHIMDLNTHKCLTVTTSGSFTLSDCKNDATQQFNLDFVAFRNR